MLLTKKILLEAGIGEDLDELKSLAQKHVANVKKIDALQEEIDALLLKQEKLQNGNSAIEDNIKKIIGETKSQSIRFGKILIDMNVEHVTSTSKSSPQYKNVVLELQKTYNIEKKIIDELCTKYNSGNVTTTKVHSNLSITKESKQLKENLTLSLKTIWYNFKGVFTKWFKSFVNQNDYLEQLVQTL